MLSCNSRVCSFWTLEGVPNGRDPRLRNDLYCVGWDVKPYSTLMAATVVLLVVLVLVVVTHFRKMAKAFLIRNGKLRNLAYTFVTSLPPGLPS